jgi:hypothetical protein
MLDALLKPLPGLKVGFGVYVAGDAVYITKVAMGIRGLQVEQRHCLPWEQGSLQKHLRTALLRKEATGKPPAGPAAPIPNAPRFSLFQGIRDAVQATGRMIKHTLVAVGVSDTNALCASFALQTKTTELETVIAENPRAAFLTSNDLAVDLMGAALGSGPVVLAAAAKKTYIAEVLQSCDDVGLRPIRIEPGRWAALRAAWHYAPPQRGEALEIRILLGSATVLAALSQGRIPLAWDSMDRGQDELADLDRLRSLVRRLLDHASAKLKMPAVGQIVLQGGPAVAQPCIDAIARISGAPVKIIPGPPCDGHLTAMGLAIGALVPEDPALNLARSQQKRVQLLAIFPRAQAAVALAAVLLTLAWLQATTFQLQRQLRIIKRENAQGGWAFGKTASDLERMNDKLLKEAGPLNEYLANRIAWAPVLEEAAALLPPSSALNSIALTDTLWGAKAGKAADERSVSLQVSNECPGGGIPNALENYWAALTGAPTFGSYFPSAQLSTLQWHSEKGGSEKDGKEKATEWVTAGVLFTPQKASPKIPAAAAERPGSVEP